MHNPIIIYLVIGLFFLVTISAHSQSGWVREKGGIYAQMSATSFSSDEYYTVDGLKSSGNNTFRQRSINLYAEYGFTSRFTVILNTSILRLNSYKTTNIVAAPGDLRLELKYALSKKIPLSISIAPEIPIGAADNFATAKKPNDLGVKEQINLATTDGEFNVWTTVAASAPFPAGKGWLSLFGSWNFRTKGFSDQIYAGIEVGAKPIEKLYFKGRMSVLASANDPKTNVPFFRGEGTEMTAAAVGAGWQFNQNWGITVDYWRNFDFIVSPKNAYVAPVFLIGVFYKK